MEEQREMDVYIILYNSQNPILEKKQKETWDVIYQPDWFSFLPSFLLSFNPVCCILPQLDVFVLDFYIFFGMLQRTIDYPMIKPSKRRDIRGGKKAVSKTFTYKIPPSLSTQPLKTRINRRDCPEE